MAHVGQVGRHMRARVVGGRTEQVLDAGGLGQHERAVLPKLPQSASICWMLLSDSTSFRVVFRGGVQARENLDLHLSFSYL